MNVRIGHDPGSAKTSVSPFRRTLFAYMSTSRRHIAALIIWWNSSIGDQ